MIDDRNEITRRDFLLTSAMITATSASGYAQPILGSMARQEASSSVTMPAVEVNMGSVFPAGGVYFRKSNPPWKTGNGITRRLHSLA